MGDYGTVWERMDRSRSQGRTVKRDFGKEGVYSKLIGQN
jgi:hypothetical protein